jgi:hypothetical protein
MSLFSIGLEKEFVLWKLHFYNKLIYQVSENRAVIEVPALLYYNSTYLNHTWKFKITGGSLQTMLGMDIRYCTNYNAYSFNPSWSLFYQDGKQTIGNYPFVDVWLNVKLKRTRFFAKYQNISSTWWNRKDYYYAASYPANPKTFKFGLTWTFYD